MANRLAAESSPYLRAHAGNPVDWFAWGPEAFERARAENRPVLVSIGYAACHWCHVMARESFADPGTAADMNAHFVCVKVDREERPDLDALYMAAAHAIAGRGGWPLNVFLTPAQVPFFAGTYFPETARHGLPAWRTVLAAVADAWATRRFQIDLGAERILGRLAGDAAAEPSARPFAADDLRLARERLAAAHDGEHGGFGGAPKFPPACALEFLLVQGEREMTAATLRAMAAGGIHDQIGGGFARYAVDAAWHVPHFEKMLHDNALLARAYLHGWQVLGDGRLRDVCCETLDWALRELALPGGGFGAALDADTEGVEGAFYTWRAEELAAALGEAAAAAGTTTPGGHAAPDEAATFGLALSEELGERGVLVLSDPDRPPSAALRDRLLAVRARRPAPARDDTCISAWNALMIGTLAEAGAVLEREDYLAAASACAEHLLATLRRPDGRVLRTAAGAAGGLQDHAFVVEALLDLYAATFAPRWFRAARETADVMIARFADERRGGFFETADDHERLIARRKDLGDRPMPSGSSSAALGLLRLAALTGEAGYERRAEGALRLVHETAVAHPDGFGHALQAIAFVLAEPREVALVGADTRPLERVVRAAFRPHVVLAGGAADGVPLLEGRGRVDGPATAYVCERFACRQPVSDPAELAALL